MDILKFTGFIKYNDEIRPFYFENGILTIMAANIDSLYLSDIEWFKDFNVKKSGWLDRLIFEGITSSKYKVYFFLLDSNKYESGNYKYAVDFVYICRDDSANAIDGIKIKGPEINYFYDVRSYINQDFKLEGNCFSNYSYEITSHPDTSFGKFRIHNYNVSIKGSFSWKKENDTYKPLEVAALLVLELSKKTDNFDFMFELINLTSSVFKLLCYRKNISLDEITTFVFDNNHKRKDIGNIYIFNNIKRETDTKIIKKMITSDGIYNSIGNLYYMMNKDCFYTAHISEDYNQRNIYTPQKMLSILIAFEHYFSKLYPNLNTRSDEFIKVQENTVQFLDNKIKDSHGKLREKYKEMKRSVSKINDSYMANLKKSLNDNVDVLNDFITKIYIEPKKSAATIIDECCSRSNNVRNKMAHGDLDIDFTVDNSHDIKLIELLIYSMILRKLEIPSDIIKEKLSVLFNYNI